MSEIADELERMAKEFEDRCVELEGELGQLTNVDDFEAATLLTGRIEGLRSAAARLRERAAELRVRCSAPTYKPQPKPAEVKAGQWWAFRGNEPERITSIEEHEHGARAFFSDLDYEYTPVSRLLDSYLFEYLGDGPEPAR